MATSRLAAAGAMQAAIESIYATDGSGNVTGLVEPDGTTLKVTLGPVTFANLLSTYPAASYSGYTALVSDIGGSTGSYFVSDGTRWKALNGRCMLYAGAGNVNAGATSGAAETIIGQVYVPAGLFKNTDRIDLRLTFSHTGGTAETCTQRLRVGPAGTTSDQLTSSSSSLATTQLANGVTLTYRRESATSIQKLGHGSSFTNGWSGMSTTQVASPQAVTTMDNAFYFDISAQMSVGTEIVTLVDLEAIIIFGTA
jgi:hypothetical protein